MFQTVLDEESSHFEEKLNSDIAKLFKESGLTLSVAESVTGGLLGGRIVATPGSSDYFLGGVICYHPMVKIQLLGVPAELIRDHGAVSEPVTSKMLEGIVRLTKSDVAVATTGIAGPANAQYPDTMTGTVFIGISMQKTQKVHSFKFEGDRETIQDKTVQTALVYLKNTLDLNQKGGH